MKETTKGRLAPKAVYYKRIKKNVFIAAAIMLVSLAIGIVGYKITIPQFDWYDSLLNASMILSGMGPVIENGIVLSKSGKVFASAYALFSGITFLSTFSILIAPVIHRFFHRIHLEDNN